MEVSDEPVFWKEKSLLEMNDEEWESICDCCGQCCYLRFFDENERNTTLCLTRVACDFVDFETGKCTCYENRFQIQKKCNKLTKNNIPIFKYFPKTCAYRLLSENKDLPMWHPLITGNFKSVPHIQNSIHENEIVDFHDYVFEKITY